MSNDLNIPSGTFLGHPKGLYLLFVTEMWERFSYYGMRALLVLYAAAATHAVNPGLGWADGQALTLYAWYTGFVYLTPLFGGWLADNFLGQRKSVIIGGLVMAAGQFLLAAPLDELGITRAFSLSALGIAFPDAPTELLPRPAPVDPRQRAVQAEHLDDGRRPVSAGRCAPRRRIRHLLHGHQHRRLPRAARLLDARRGPRLRLARRIPRRRHRHVAVGDHPARLRAALHRQRRPRTGGEALAPDGGRQQAAAHEDRARPHPRDLRDLHLRRDLLGDVRAGGRAHEPVRRKVRAAAGRLLPGADRLVPVAESALHRAARHPVLDAVEPARRDRGRIRRRRSRCTSASRRSRSDSCAS